MTSPNPNQNTIFWRGLTPEHLEIIPENLYKTTGFLSKWSRHKSTDFSTSLRIKAPCHSFILLPMPPSANPGLSIGNFGIVWATCMMSKRCHHKNVAVNVSTHHETGDWASICHPFVFLHFASNASKCKPWPFNGPCWNSVWLLVWFPSAATIKWLAPTFQPTMKLVIEPAPAILLGWNCLESWKFNPITNFKLG